MILYLYGTDIYRSREKLNFYKDGFIKKYDPSALNIKVLDGEKLTMEDFRKAVASAGFLSKKRMIIIENLVKNNKDKKIQKEIVDYLESKEWIDDNVLIFWEEDEEEGYSKKKKSQATKVNPLINYLGNKKSEEFELLKGEGLNKWIIKEIRDKKGKIENPAVLGLASLVGPNLWQMEQEINKLVNYKKNKMITADDVRLMVKARYDENIFHLTDALSQKNIKLSFKLLNDQISLGVHELYILTMLVRQFRILLQVREVLGQEDNYYAVASRLNLHPFVAQKAILQARGFTFEELKKIYHQLFEIDFKIKTGRADSRVLFDLLITKICQGKL